MLEKHSGCENISKSGTFSIMQALVWIICSPFLRLLAKCSVSYCSNCCKWSFQWYEVCSWLMVDAPITILEHRWQRIVPKFLFFFFGSVFFEFQKVRWVHSYGISQIRRRSFGRDHIVSAQSTAVWVDVEGHGREGDDLLL